MTRDERGKIRRSRSKGKSWRFWLAGPFCRWSHAIFLFSLCFMTLPQTSREQEISLQNELARTIFPDSDESNHQLMDNTFTSVLAAPETPETVTVASPPSLRQMPSVRSRSTVKTKGGGDHHNHQQQPKFSAETSVIVTTPLGKIQGRSYYINKTGEWVGGFLGVPYAQPPVHRLRFRPPMPLQSLTKDENDILNATDFGAICIQPAEQKIWDVLYLKNNRVNVRKRKLDNYNMSEDCLTLNIYVPLKAHLSVPTEPVLPVFFFIHGGSYYMNAGRLYPGQILASVQNLIVVTFNYRLGPLGFLSTEDEAATGNYGLLDQSMALDWVYRNIQHFGGDPNRITLVGNSAGAASVLFHTFSDLSKGKFVGVTVQSGCSGAPWAIQHSPKKHAEDLATKLGCPTFPTSDMVECIRNFTPETIMKKAKLEDGLSLAYATVIDGKYGGKFLMDHPEALIRSRSFQPVPVLTGFTKDEVTIWFTKFGPTTKMKDLRSFVQVDVVSLMESLQTVTQANMAAMIHSVTVQYLYRAGSKENDTFGKTTSISDFISDVGLKAPCIKEMNLFTKFNPKPVFLYEFTYFSVDDVKMNRQDWIGAYHESELQFVFGETYMNYSNHLRSFDDKIVSDFMMKIWGNFVRYGNPNNPTSSKSERSSTGLKFAWTNYTEYNQDFAVLGLKSHMSKHFLTDRMLFWNFFFPIFRDYAFRYNPTTPCDEWEIVSKSWTFWALLLVTMALGFALSMLIMVRLKRKMFSSSRIRTNNNTSLAPASGINHVHYRNSNSVGGSSSINHRHSASAHRSSNLLIGQHGNGNGGGGGGDNSSSSNNLLHGANGTRLLSSTNSNTGTNVPINM